MSKTILITRPDHDMTTRYLSCWAAQIIKFAEKKNIEILDLKREKANKKELEGRIKKKNPLFIFINGHGSEDAVTGHDNKILIKSGKNEKLLKNKIIYALSCRSATKLGKASINSGAASYIGYTNDFIFCYDEHKISRPTEDKVAKNFFEPSNQIALSLIKENDSGTASQKSKKLFFTKIQKLLSSDSPEGSSQYAKYLWWDMKYQVCLGDKKSKFC